MRGLQHPFLSNDKITPHFSSRPNGPNRYLQTFLATAAKYVFFLSTHGILQDRSYVRPGSKSQLIEDDGNIQHVFCYSGMKLEISKRKKLRNITDTKKQMSASENAKIIMTKLETNENTTHKSNEMEQSQL